MRLVDFLNEMKDVESRYGQVVRWQSDGRQLLQKSELRMAVIDYLLKHCNPDAHYPTDDVNVDKHFDRRLTEVAFSGDTPEDPLPWTWRRQVLVKELNDNFAVAVQKKRGLTCRSQ